MFYIGGSITIIAICVMFILPDLSDGSQAPEERTLAISRLAEDGHDARTVGFCVLLDGVAVFSRIHCPVRNAATPHDYVQRNYGIRYASIIHSFCSCFRQELPFLL
jgi:hypothetical protein